MKTPKEIKKALEFCKYEDYCYDCAYLDECVDDGNIYPLVNDALALIRKLKAQISNRQRGGTVV